MKKYLQGAAIGQNSDRAHLQLTREGILSTCVQGMTSIGKGRKKNQDAVSAYVEMGCDCPKKIFSIADGLGFYEFSEHAAYHTVSCLPADLFNGIPIDEACIDLHQELLSYYPYIIKGMRDVNQPHRGGEGATLAPTKDMGATTLVLAVVQNNVLQLSNIGDSRAYLIRDNQILYKTKDQSLIDLLVSKKELDPKKDNLRMHPMRSVILNALGSPEKEFQYFIGENCQTKNTGLPITEVIELKPGDLLLMATDGAYTNLSEKEWLSLLYEPWGKILGLVSQKIDQILVDEKITSGELATLDNYSFLVYRHGG